MGSGGCPREARDAGARHSSRASPSTLPKADDPGHPARTITAAAARVRRLLSRASSRLVKDREATGQLIVSEKDFTFQIRSAYSLMARSEEKKPLRAVFSSDSRVQRPRSAHVPLMASWARR